MAAKMFQGWAFGWRSRKFFTLMAVAVVFHIPGRPRGTADDFEGAYLMRAGKNWCR